MNAATRTELLPRRALLGVAGALGLSVAAVTVLRLAGFTPREPDAPALRERRLRFADRADGGIDVIDGGSGEVIDRVHGEQGFLRGTLRGLARERRRRGLGADAPLALVARADGRLTLVDPSTAERIDLESFGPSNAAVYARWLGPTPTRKDLP